MERLSVMANQKQSNERRCILKPRYEMGDKVYAAWMGADRAGRVETYREVVTAVRGEDSGSGAYGPIRIYQIKFDTVQMPLPKTGVSMAMAGSVVDGIPEHVVVSKRDYLLLTSHGVAHCCLNNNYPKNFLCNFTRCEAETWTKLLRVRSQLRIPQTGTSEQAANKQPTSSQRLLCFLT